MKLVIRPRDPGQNLTGQVDLRLISGNNIKVWTSPVKFPGTQVSLPMTTSADQLPITLYIEALEPSESLREIVFEAEYGGKTDRVSATAVWVELEEVFNENSHQFDMQLLSEFSCIETSVNFNYDEGNNSYFGLARITNFTTITQGGQPQTVIQQKGRILFQWQLTPASANSLVRIDGTRQRHTNNWKLNLDLPSGPDCKFEHTETPFPFNDSPIPEDNELPNDDSSTDCIDHVNSDGKFVTWDPPGVTVNQEFIDGGNFPQFWGYGNDKTNFLEWVRLAPVYTNLKYFNPTGVSGGELIGSRASEKIPWSYGRYSAKDDEFMLELNDNPYALNHIRVVNQIPHDHEYYPIDYTVSQMDHSYLLGTYHAAIFNDLGDDKVIVLVRINPDANGDCNVVVEDIDMDEIPVETTVYDLPFNKHEVEITETEGFDMLFLNWHTFYSTNKVHELNFNQHLINLNH